ncbi:MAG: XTP/dITP diphosphatase [Phycisphaeraceae bacterium]
MELLIATGNPHKLDEMRAILDDATVSLRCLADLPEPIDEPVEDGETFEANAELKARYYAKATGMLCLADDSGLEVDALHGEPGVRSARYSNTNGQRAERDTANCALLMKNLDGVPAEQRTARFVCAMALVDGRAEDDPLVALVRGTMEGRIITPDQAEDPAHPERGRGHNGFGYDPLVYLPDRGKTVAELSSEDKNAISHRGNALMKILPYIRRTLGNPSVVTG